MIESWENIKIKDFVSVTMGQSPESKYYNTTGIGLPFLQGNRTFGSKYPSFDTYCSNGNKFAERNDILISVRAPVGDLNVAKEKICIGRGVAGLRMKNGNFDFLYYLMKANINKVIENESGTVFGSINKKDIENIEVSIPKSSLEQRAIAEVLSALDDKIELNRRMNRTLEQLAQAIYKQMFIDNPEREKWKDGTLSDFCDTQYGFTASSSDKEVGPKFLRITDMNKDPWISWDQVPYCQISKKDLEKYRLNIGDLLVSRMADPGKAAIVEVDINAVFASYLVRLNLHNKDLSYYIFYFLTSPEYLEYANGAMSGSVQSGMNARVITGVNLTIPPNHLTHKFNELIRPIRHRIQSNIVEISTLAELRDTLLPKLMSGQVRVTLNTYNNLDKGVVNGSKDELD